MAPIITFLTRRSTVKGMIVVSVIVAYGLVYPFLDSAGILYTIPVLLTAWFFGWPAGLIVAFLFFPLNLVIVRTLTEKESIEWIKDGGALGVIALASTAVVVGLLQDLRSKALRATDDLRKSKEVVEAASRAKSEFLANMSHELRTPLNSIIGFSEILQDETFGELNERQSRYVGNVLSSGRHLLELINDVLDLSRIEAGRIELYLSQFEVRELLEEAHDIIRPMADMKDISVSTEEAKGLPSLTADRGRLRQIMLNLLSNAVKFTAEGGRVDVEALVAQDGVLRSDQTVPAIRISVSDTGVGIKPEDQYRIFVLFEQVDSSYSRDQEGTGLGLALSKRLVEAHGGTISVESEGVNGKGSTFTLVMPVEPPTIRYPTSG